MKWFKFVFMLLLLIPFGKEHLAKAEEQWTWPVSGVISDYFGTRGGRHYGIDIAAAIGTPVAAVSGGKVTRSYYSESYGNVVFIRHNNGYEAVYAHLNKRLVREGQIVKGGQTIGEAGNTGHSRGAHLHFEVHKESWNFAKTNAVNPLLVLGEPPAQTVSASSYTVQKGDTLLGIARRFGLTVYELKEKNHLNSDRIYPNQQLVIN
ncbi:peptidoglycan DD-metalloendopeptidase family protein [Ectobacillus panaciterrae]|uniref:peptidoglycan DD-metalloendopeptidase family protein n=1 Tax=Ectobacillus panaciterrae TaxID=363872 RepID=UPI0003F55CFD|nr:peptidoglycan DD-metalloendopeptidase family protein [Ectobacillus panaciterrae]